MSETFCARDSKLLPEDASNPRKKNLLRPSTYSKAGQILGILRASYTPYRRGALFLKFLIGTLAITAVNSSTYASVSLLQLGKISRLMGPLNEVPKIHSEPFDRGGSLCGKQASSDLILSFPRIPGEWISGLVEFKKNFSAGETMFCDVKASPIGDEQFEIRFSFRQDRKKKQFEFVAFKTASSFIIDFWPGSVQTRPAAATRRKPVESRNAKAEKKGDKQFQFNPLAGYAAQGTLVDAFEDAAQWDRLLGEDASSFDLNTPELNRFRHAGSEQSRKQISDVIERLELKLPFLALPPFENALEFPLDLMIYEDFSLEALDEKFASSDNGPRREKAKGAVKGMNLVQRYVQEKDYLKARQALEILESSQVRGFLPMKNPHWWALKGHLFVNLGRELKQKVLVRRGFNYWRDGSVLLAGASGNAQAYVEFMTSRLIKNFFDEKQFYLAASILEWSKKYSWSQKLEERFAYFRPEVLYQLNLFDEAQQAFNIFFKMREDKPINAFIDRRLVPAAAFRIGDIAFRMRDYKEAAVQYGYALNNVPTAGKFAFEGNWYPEEITVFPHVMFNRAESFIQVGAYQQALKDLRSLVYIAPQHPNASLILYRIGDLLEFVGAPEEKVVGAWRECIFRFPGTLGGKLCEARKSARDLIESPNPVTWPRLIGMIDEALPQKGRKFWAGVPKDELTTYVNLIVADAFIRKNEPRQAMFRLDPLLKLDPSVEMKAWMYEYALTSIAGSLLKDIKEGRYKDVITSYDKRRREILANQTRHEILWALALAYEKLNLIEEASQVLAQAERVKSVIARKRLRPFELPPEDWAEFRSRLNLKLFKENKAEASVVAQSLNKTDPESLEAMRMKAEFYGLTGRLKEAAQSWKKIAAKDHLSFDEIKKYSLILKDLKEQKSRTSLLETKVGIWLTEKNKAGLEAMPPAELLMDLAELRAKENTKWLGALSIYEFLLSLEPSKLGPLVTQAMINYRRGQILREMGRIDDARQSFERARALEPDSVWGKLASSALKELDALQASQKSSR